MHEGERPPAIVDAVEVDERGVLEEVGALTHQRPRADQPVLLGVGKDDADSGVRRQRIDDRQDGQDAGAVVHGPGRIIRDAAQRHEQCHECGRECEHERGGAGESGDEGGEEAGDDHTRQHQTCGH